MYNVLHVSHQKTGTVLICPLYAEIALSKISVLNDHKQLLLYLIALSKKVDEIDIIDSAKSFHREHSMGAKRLMRIGKLKLKVSNN